MQLQDGWGVAEGEGSVGVMSVSVAEGEGKGIVGDIGVVGDTSTGVAVCSVAASVG